MCHNTKGTKKESAVVIDTFEPIRPAPISNVPDDVLFCIFQELFSNTPEEESYRRLHFDARRAYRSTLVCKRWRRIITSAPRFWAEIEFSSYSSRDQAIALRFIREQVVYAQKLPLSITSFDGITAALLDVLRPALDQITSVWTAMEYQHYKETLTTCSLLPNLHRLCLDIHFDDIMIDSDSDMDAEEDLRLVFITLAASDFPLLTDIELDVDYVLAGISLPWAQLTSLRVDLALGGDLDPSILVTGLERIEKLELNLGSNEFHPPVAGNLHITLPYLRTLSLTGYEQDNFPFQFLRDSNLPSLQELDFSLKGGYQQFIEAMNNPQIRSVVSLRLELGSWMGNSHTPDEVQGVINSLRGFARLEMFSCNVHKQPHAGDRVFQVLGSNSSSMGCLFPLLRELEIKEVDFNAQELISMQVFLRSRLSSIDAPLGARKALKSVTVSFYREVDQDYDMWTEQVSKPAAFNDIVTSVAIKLLSEGPLPTDFLERVMGLPGFSGESEP